MALKRISTPVLVVGALMRRPINEYFALLRSSGVVVTWADKDSGILSTTYYNLTLEGDERLLKRFENWVKENS